MTDPEKLVMSKFYVRDMQTGVEKPLFVNKPHVSPNRDGVYRFTPVSDDEGEIEFTQNGQDLKVLPTPGIEIVQKKDLAPWGLLFDNTNPVRIRHRDQEYNDAGFFDKDSD